MNIGDLKENRFTEHLINENPREEAFARDWEVLLKQHTGTDWEFLRNICIELNFPVNKGQSETPEFLAALKRGLLPLGHQSTCIPDAPDKIRVYLHSTPVGRLPVIECESDSDFIYLHQSLACRCEPVPVPSARGATIIKNYNNWGRIAMHRKEPSDPIPQDTALYRDYIAILSHRNYSGVAPHVLGLENAEWRQKSVILRREHEAAHYMTQRYYNSSKNEIHDEIIADFMGLTTAFGEYDPDKFLAFLGLENYPEYRLGGRLEIYLPTNSRDFSLLCTAIVQAANNIVAHYRKINCDRIKMLHILCRTSVADMAKGAFA